VKVLYVNHTAHVSGAERSLLTLVDALDGQIEPRAAVPSGDLSARLSARGVPVATLTGTAGSLRLHPLHTARAGAEMAAAAVQLHRVERRWRVDVVHANSIRAALIAALARPRAPIVAHVRDRLPAGAVSAATLRIIAASARAIIANSRYTAAAVTAAAPSARVQVIYNPVDVSVWDPARFDRDAERAALGVGGPRPLLLGVVAQITPWKGQDTAIRALAMLRARGVDARLLVIGSAKFTAASTRHDNVAYLADLHRLVAELGVGEHVSWLGEREDTPRLVRALDALMLPSSQEPFGRAVIEAMAMGVPVLATSVGGPAEIITDGLEGLLLAPGDPAAWAAAAALLSEDQLLCATMGAAGRRRVTQAFTAEHHGTEVLELYRSVTA